MNNQILKRMKEIDPTLSWDETQIALELYSHQYMGEIEIIFNKIKLLFQNCRGFSIQKRKPYVERLFFSMLSFSFADSQPCIPRALDI